MLLNKLLAKLDARVEFFSTCLVSSGWRLRLPGPPAAMLHFVLEGKGTLRLSGGNELPLQAGFLAVIPKGSRHALASNADVHRESQVDLSINDTTSDSTAIVAGDSKAVVLTVACGLVRIRYGSALGLFDHLEDALVVDLSEESRSHSIFDDLLSEQTDQGPGSTAMKTALMSQCLILMLRRLCQQGECRLPWISALRDPRLARALEHILEDPAKPHTVDLLAAVAAMSRSAFAESFANAFGIPPMAMVRRVRLERARYLLEQANSPSVDEVARRVGYFSRSHFSRSFKKQHGIAPAVVGAMMQ